MNQTLQELREQIDIIDQQVIALLAERFRVTKKVGVFKRDNNLPPVDLSREAVQFERIRNLANQAGLDTDFAQSMLRLIINEVVRNHTALRKEARHEK